MTRSFLLLVLLVSVSFASIGKIVSSRGNIDVIRGDNTLKASSGFELEKKDLLKTGPKAKMQIIFNDETVVTIGKKSEFKVYDYFYKKGDKKPKASFGFLKGSFKSVTGKIGKVAKERFVLKTKTASMGIRGTTIVGQVSDAGDKIACTDGAIVVTSLTTGVTVPVPAGKITTVKKGSNPTPARNYSPAEISSMENDTVEEQKETKKEDSKESSTNEEKEQKEETTSQETATTEEETVVEQAPLVDTTVQTIESVVDTTNNDIEDQVQETIEKVVETIEKEKDETTPTVPEETTPTVPEETTPTVPEETTPTVPEETIPTTPVEVTELQEEINSLDISVSTWNITTVTATKTSIDELVTKATTLDDTETITLANAKLNEFYGNVVSLTESWLKDNTNSGKIVATVDSVNSAEINQDYYDKLIFTYNQVSGDQVSATKLLDILPDEFDIKIQDDIDANQILKDKLSIIRYKVEYDYFNNYTLDGISLKDIRNINDLIQNADDKNIDELKTLATSISSDDEDFSLLISGIDYTTLHDTTSKKAVEVLQTEITNLGSFDASGDFDTIRAFNKSSKTIDYYATKIKDEVSDDCIIDNVSCSNKAMDSYNSIEATYKNSSSKLREYFDGQKSSYISDINNIFNGNSLGDSPICTGLDDCSTKLGEMLVLAEDVKSELHKDEQSNLEAIYTTNSELDIKVQALKLAQIVVKIRDFDIGTVGNTNKGNSKDLEKYLDTIKLTDIADIFDEIKKVATEVEDYSQSFNFKRDDDDIINKNINEQSLINMRDLEDKVVNIVKNIETGVEKINGNIADTTKDKLASLIFDMTTLRQDRDITDTSLISVETESDDYLQLGFWEYKGDNEKRNFSWISGTKTAEDKIQNLIDNKQKATYNGKVYGTVITNKAMEQIDSANSKVNMNFDFGSQNVDGSMEFKSVNTNWKVGFDKGTVNKSGFGINQFTSEHTGNIEGNYYGSDAQAVGGAMNIKDSSNNIAVGSFSATKASE
jgi:hypothetical protein